MAPSSLVPEAPYFCAFSAAKNGICLRRKAVQATSIGECLEKSS